MGAVVHLSLLIVAGQFRKEISTLENVSWEGSFHTAWLVFIDVTNILPKSLGQLQKQLVLRKCVIQWPATSRRIVPQVLEGITLS